MEVKTASQKGDSFYQPEFDEIRLGKEQQSGELQEEPYRTNYRRDYGRLIHSPAFRRLAAKTQLYPGQESDFFRNRLSHSMEVAQIAKSIAIRLNYLEKFAEGSAFDLDTDLIEFAALAHDIGHPPFGHQGEEALDQCMMDHGGFEGNAQTLRILTKLEKKILRDRTNAPTGIDSGGEDVRLGLNLCYRTVAAILKYAWPIPPVEERLKLASETEKLNLHAFKGYYQNESEIVKKATAAVLRNATLSEGTKFKTIECSIMDIADDIAYSTYDLEDGLKGGFFNPLDMIFSNFAVLERVAKQVSKKLETTITTDDIRDIFVEIFDRWIYDEAPKDWQYDDKGRILIEPFTFLKNTYQRSLNLAKDGHTRTSLSSFLVGRFIRGIKVYRNDQCLPLSYVYFDDETKKMVEVLKTYNYEAMIVSPRLRVAEYRGKDIVTTIFCTLNNKNGKGIQLMPQDFQEVYYTIKQEDKPRVICDFVAGMTDRYCIEFYGRLKSERPETIFKPF